MKTIYFVRHGECQANVDGCTAGLNDSPLTSLGLKQAEETGEQLKEFKVDLIVSSPLSRAKVTAERIAAKIGYKGEIRLEPLLHERDFGVMSGRPRDIAFPAIDTGTVEGLESVEDFAARMSSVLELLAALPGTHILVVGHSAAEQMLRTIYEKRPYQSWLDTPNLHNGHIREYAF